MEKFMYLFRNGDEQAVSPEAMQASLQLWLDWIDQLAKAGKFVAGEQLIPMGKTVSGKSKIITDGPYAEGKEIIGGYFIIQARDLEEALELSKDCPIFDENGAVEVRPILNMEAQAS